MEFDPTNKIIQLCAQGMDLEGEGTNEEALKLFLQAWNESATDFEKFTAAHYVARHQKSVAEKLEWDEKALRFALKINDSGVKGTYPSLYLNVGKCYEDLNDFDNAKKNYLLALSFTDESAEDGYSKMIRNGIKNGLARVS